MKKVKFILVGMSILALIAVNFASLVENDSDTSISLTSVVNIANADGESGGDTYTNWQECTLKDEAGNEYETCKDPCDGTSGDPCDEELECALGLESYC